MRTALHDRIREQVRGHGLERGRDPIAAAKKEIERFAAGGALDYETLSSTEDEYDLDVKGCAYAKLYEELGEPELGFLLVCSLDLAAVEGWGGTLELARTQTIMEGAARCDFRFRRKR